MEKADRILSALFERLNVSDNEGYVRLFSTWRTVCDEISSRGLADHSAIVDVRHGTVIVAVDHPGWLQLIQIQEKRLLAKLQKRFPDMGLKAIHFHITRERVDYGKAPGDSKEKSAQHSDRSDEDNRQKDASNRKEPSGSQMSGSSGTRAPSDPDEPLGRISDPNLRKTLERLREDLEEQ